MLPISESSYTKVMINNKSIKAIMDNFLSFSKQVKSASITENNVRKGESMKIAIRKKKKIKKPTKNKKVIKLN